MWVRVVMCAYVSLSDLRRHGHRLEHPRHCAELPHPDWVRLPRSLGIVCVVLCLFCYFFDAFMSLLSPTLSDDNIAVKSGEGAEGRAFNRSSSDILIIVRELQTHIQTVTHKTFRRTDRHTYIPTDRQTDRRTHLSTS